MARELFSIQENLYGRKKLQAVVISGLYNEGIRTPIRF